MSASIPMEELHGKIVTEMSDAILFADAEGVIRLWNAGAERLFGHTAGEAVGKSLDLIIPEKLRGRHWEGFHRVMASGDTKYKEGLLAAPGVRKDGTRVSLAFSMLVVRGAGGEILGCASVLRDVTAQWEREKELKERIRLLEEGAGSGGR